MLPCCFAISRHCRLTTPIPPPPADFPPLPAQLICCKYALCHILLFRVSFSSSILSDFIYMQGFFTIMPFFLPTFFRPVHCFSPSQQVTMSYTMLSCTNRRRLHQPVSNRQCRRPPDLFRHHSYAAVIEPPSLQKIFSAHADALYVAALRRSMLLPDTLSLPPPIFFFRRQAFFEPLFSAAVVHCCCLSFHFTCLPYAVCLLLHAFGFFLCCLLL